MLVVCECECDDNQYVLCYCICSSFFFFKQKTAYEMRISDWSSDVCSSDLVVMPELGLVLPGMVIAAGDSHSTTYGAFGVVGFGIGTSDIEQLLATQTLVYRRLKTMRVTIDGMLAPGITAKDLIMEVIRRLGADGAVGHAVEFAGGAIDALGVEARMTICNMAVECGARVALMAADDKEIGRAHV